MPVPTQYFTTTKHVNEIFEAVKKAGVPEKFNYEFLKKLGFASSSDRPMIGVLKALGFLDANNVPTERYSAYRDTSKSKSVMAEGIRDAYVDLFEIDESVHKSKGDELRGMFARTTGKGDEVVKKMATTFLALVALADFSGSGNPPKREETVETDETGDEEPDERVGSISLRHDIHIHLPVSTDIRVYEAVFRALKAHLQ